MTLAELRLKIDAYIKANGVKAITGDIANMILNDIVNYFNANIGALTDLDTTNKDSIVEAINEVFSLISAPTGSSLYTGATNPNDVPPNGGDFEVLDFYLQTALGVNYYLYIYTSIPGIGWFNLTQDNKEVIFFSGALPSLPNKKVLYVDALSGEMYMWDGTQYIPLIPDNEAQWGDITGQLSDQTDLQGELDLKADKVITITGTGDLTGGGSLAANRTIDILPATKTKINNGNTAYSQRIQNLTTTGSSGVATLNSNTLNIPSYTLAGLGGVPTSRTITINGTTQNLSANRTWNISPDYSTLTNERHIKKTAGGLVDSNIQDTAVGSEVLGRLDSSATVERRIVRDASSSFTIDLNEPAGQYDLILTGNTTIDFSNMIESLQSTVITLIVWGDYSLLFPSWLKPMPSNDDYYSPSSLDANLITILISGGGGTPRGIYSLTNVDLAQ